MIGRILLINAVLLIIYMTLAFMVGKSRKRLDTVDTAWGLGFVITAWSVAVQQPDKVTLLVAILVSIWGLRLSAHIGRRSMKGPDDRRYAELSSKWRGNFWLRAYFSVFLLQGLLVWVIGLPVVMASGQNLQGLKLMVVLGSMIWLAGFIIETAADWQLRHFLQTKNRPKLLQTGLWRYSRHPNYFGELTMWWGIGLIALHASYGWIGLSGPLVLTVLIVFISGIPPIERRRAKDPAYRAYQNRTSPLILLPPRS